MVSDRVAGIILILVSIIIITVYIILEFFPPDITVFGDPIDIFVLKVMGLIALILIFGLLSWIGYTLIKSPRPGIREIAGDGDESDKA